MDSEQKNPPDEQPKQGHLSFLKVLLCAADWSFLPLVEYIEGEWGTIKVFWKEARGLCILITLCLFFGGWLLKGCVDTPKMEALNAVSAEKGPSN